jgi:DNA-binding CsgD family transcriptional regulator
MTTPPNPFFNNQTIIALHEARETRDLASALFKFIAQSVEQEVLFLMLRPLEFELRSFCSRPEFQPISDYHIAEGHKDDIWLQRSPKGPDVPVVLHSRYTPQKDFRESRFYHQVMEKIGCEYGASLVAWEKDTWLGSLTIFRTEAQGDFRDDEKELLSACHLHFQSAIRRIAKLNEQMLSSHSLESFIWNLPTAAMLLDWELKPHYCNASGQELLAEWQKGVRVPASKRVHPSTVPKEIADAIEGQKEALVKGKPSSPGAPNTIPLIIVPHPRSKELSAEVSFLPSKSLAVTKGTFLVVFYRHHDTPDDRESYDRFTKLSPRERQVVLLAADGHSNPEIAKKLGTSEHTVRKQLISAYAKLGVNRRSLLAGMFSQNSLVNAGLKQKGKNKDVAKGDSGTT